LSSGGYLRRGLAGGLDLADSLELTFPSDGSAVAASDSGTWVQWNLDVIRRRAGTLILGCDFTLMGFDERLDVLRIEAKHPEQTRASQASPPHRASFD